MKPKQYTRRSYVFSFQTVAWLAYHQDEKFIWETSRYKPYDIVLRQTEYSRPKECKSQRQVRPQTE